MRTGRPGLGLTWIHSERMDPGGRLQHYWHCSPHEEADGEQSGENSHSSRSHMWVYRDVDNSERWFPLWCQCDVRIYRSECKWTSFPPPLPPPSAHESCSEVWTAPLSCTPVFGGASYERSCQLSLMLRHLSMQRLTIKLDNTVTSELIELAVIRKMGC